MSEQTASNNNIAIQTRLDRNLLPQKGGSCIVWMTLKAPHVVTHGPREDKGKADGESAVLAKIAEMQEPDRTMAKRLHAIITASAPAFSPKTWYGMPAYAKDGKVVCFSKARKSSTRGMRR